MRSVTAFMAMLLALAACSTLPREEWTAQARLCRDYAREATFGATPFLEPYYVECMREAGAFDLRFGCEE